MTAPGRSSNLLRGAALYAGLILCALPAPLRATWSILAMDCRTGEVAIGSATCLTTFDLREGLPVVMVGLGSGAAQSAIDSTGANRQRIRQGLVLDRTPNEILDTLENFDNNHQGRQYGIVDRRGRTATFTGNGAGAFADGLTGAFSDVVYAIQGNVITGAPVLEMAEQALIATPGDMPAKLMAAMEAARLMGGDGRCSCTSGNPTACGSPPDEFEKSAHIGFVIVTRAGDVNGNCNGSDGCANGDYFMNFNVASQSVEDPDPVFQLADMFAEWREGLVQRADAIQSSVAMDPPSFVVTDPGTANLLITLRDWNGDIVDDPELAISVDHAADSPGTATIGDVQYAGDGLFEVPITATAQVGVERFLITVEDPERPVVLMPDAVLVQADRTDLDRDGDVDLEDGAALHACVDGPDMARSDECQAADVDGGGTVDLADVGWLQRTFTAPPCKVLYIKEPPLVPIFLFCGEPLTMSVDVQADPPATLQWLLDGEPIPGATQPEYHVDAVTEADEGEYAVAVVNSCGVQITIDDNLVVVPDPRKGPCR